MSNKWTGSRSESGILRKSDYKEKKEELFVFGYSCKLFRDNDKALHIDQGKHLIPWMGDDTLKIDRYDARGALHDLSTLEAPPGGFDWRVELTRTELDVEQLCDEERYRALHTDEDEEEMYKEEELKRLHAAGYGQVGFNYDTPQEPPPPPQQEEVDEPFLPAANFKSLFPEATLFPESQKQNAIIEKTAKFIASQGAQMEILIKAKQGDNTQFQFLNKDSNLHPYYSSLISLIKAEKWPEKKVEVVEEKPPENEEYLHPSLAATVIESAPSIPSIQYRASADCDYLLLVSQLVGTPAADGYGDLPPPGTEPLPPRPAPSLAPPIAPLTQPAHSLPTAQISRAPVMYNKPNGNTEPATPNVLENYQQYSAYHPQHATAPVHHEPAPIKSTGLSLMKNYDTDSDSNDSDSDSSLTKSKTAIAVPPEDVRLVVDKMASYVARNGDEFEEIVRAKNDPRFTFLEQDNEYHPYYKRLMQQKRGVDVNGSSGDGSKSAAPVSFSIKKQKEPDPILPKPALPYESSSDDDSENQDKVEQPKEMVYTNPPPILMPNIPPAIVYRIESNPEPIKLKPIIIPPVKVVPLTPPMAVPPSPRIHSQAILTPPEVKEPPTPAVKEQVKSFPVEEVREKSLTPEIQHSKLSEYSDTPKKEKRKRREEKKEHRSKDYYESRKSEKYSLEREERKEMEKEKKRHKAEKMELENEIISLVDISDEFIDLTGDQSDTKGEMDVEGDRAKQQERRQRAAAFLATVGVHPAALPTTSLASAMVDTLETLRKKKAEEKEKRRKREKRRHRDKYGDYENGSHKKSRRRRYRSSDEDEESDYDGSKKKKRKKDKKHSSKSKKRRRREEDLEETEPPQSLNIDLSQTLRELRTKSPTRELVQEIDESTRHSLRMDSSDDEIESRKEKKKKKEDREYSEGEWSSDSEHDSETSISEEDD